MTHNIVLKKESKFFEILGITDRGNEWVLNQVNIKSNTPNWADLTGEVQNHNNKSQHMLIAHPQIVNDMPDKNSCIYSSYVILPINYIISLILRDLWMMQYSHYH